MGSEPERVPLDHKAHAVAIAQIGAHLRRPDSQIIEREGWYQILTPSYPSLSVNEVVWSECAAEEAAAIIDGTLAAYGAWQLPFKWCVGPWTRPPGFGALLDARGFSSWEVRGMVCDPSALRLSCPAEVTVEAVSLDGLDDYLDTFIAIWGLSAADRWQLQTSLAAILADAESAHRFFLARVGGACAGTATLLLRPDRTGYLLSTGVLAAFRGRGVYRALVEHRLALLRALEIRLATTQAREASSAPILERFGFETALRMRVYGSPPPGPQPLPPQSAGSARNSAP